MSGKPVKKMLYTADNCSGCAEAHSLPANSFPLHSETASADAHTAHLEYSVSSLSPALHQDIDIPAKLMQFTMAGNGSLHSFSQFPSRK